MKSKGFILPSVLAILVLILQIYLQIVTTIPGISRSIANTAHSAKAELLLKNNLVSPMHQSLTKGVKCKNSNLSRGNISLEQKLCFLFDNTNSILTFTPDALIKCNDAPANTNSTLTNSSLTEQSLVAPNICSSIPNATSLNKAILGNLELTPPTLIDSDIFVIGYINSQSGVIVDKSIKLFAGGDIKIAALSTTGQSPVNLFLHSRTGTIVAPPSTPLIRLHCIAKSHNCTPNFASTFWAPGGISTKKPIYFE